MTRMPQPSIHLRPVATQRIEKAPNPADLPQTSLRWSAPRSNQVGQAVRELKELMTCKEDVLSSPEVGLGRRNSPVWPAKP